MRIRILFTKNIYSRKTNIRNHLFKREQEMGNGKTGQNMPNLRPKQPKENQKKIRIERSHERCRFEGSREITSVSTASIERAPSNGSIEAAADGVGLFERIESKGVGPR